MWGVEGMVGMRFLIGSYFKVVAYSIDLRVDMSLAPIWLWRTGAHGRICGASPFQDLLLYHSLSHNNFEIPIISYSTNTACRWTQNNTIKRAASCVDVALRVGGSPKSRSINIDLVVTKYISFIGPLFLASVRPAAATSNLQGTRWEISSKDGSVHRRCLSKLGVGFLLKSPSRGPRLYNLKRQEIAIWEVLDDATRILYVVLEFCVYFISFRSLPVIRFLCVVFAWPVAGEVGVYILGLLDHCASKTVRSKFGIIGSLYRRPSYAYGAMLCPRNGHRIF